MPRSWQRPPGLRNLISRVESDEARACTPWAEIVGRARVAQAKTSVESAAIGGSLVGNAALDASENSWSPETIEAFERLGHDRRYGTELAASLGALKDPLSPLTADQLQGLTSSIKGTAMEIRVREMIQAGEIDGLGGNGAEVFLSSSLTQTGHDVEIVNGADEIVERVQVKSGSWEDVRARIDEYEAQGIPVAVTSETAQRAREAGYESAIVDTGISGAELTAETAAVVGNLSLGSAVDELLPELALITLAAAAALRLQDGQPAGDVKRWLVGELRDGGVANAAGIAVQLMTGVALLRPVAVLGTRWGVQRGRTAGEAAIALGHARERLEHAVPAVDRGAG